jgi:hypothetical protein
MAHQRDPRYLLGTTSLHPILARILRGFRKVDSAPTRQLPIPLEALHHACSIARAEGTPTSEAAADLMWLAFFFLLRPGKYILSGKAPHPFTLADVRLWCDTQPIDPLTAPAHTLSSATFVALIFSDQKNSVRGEVISHGRSGNPFACPVLATVRRVLDLRNANAPPDTPLCRSGPSQLAVGSKEMCSLLHSGGSAYTMQTGTPLPKLNLHALRSTGASALLAKGASTDTIKLLGRWKSESALRYLHLRSHSLMSPFAPMMLHAAPSVAAAQQTI